MHSDDRLIVALDFPAMDKVKALVETLGDTVSYYKVGMELFYSTGGEAIRYLRAAGKDVFLDLKLYDIPNTVAHSAKVLTSLGTTMFNVHASGGLAMMKAAVAAAAEVAGERQLPRPKLIAVTVVTSMNDEEWARLNQKVPIAQQVLDLARLTQEAGMDGVVASPQEAAAIREACGPDFLIVTPGVRPQGAERGDQSRVATPAGALKLGASHLVIGRPITAAADPRAAVTAILQEMREG